MSIPPVQVPTHHQIRVELFSFEKGCLEAYLENAIESIKRSYPNAAFPPFKMLNSYRLLEFQTINVVSLAPAYGFFKLKIKLIQKKSTSRAIFCMLIPESLSIFPWMFSSHSQLPTSRSGAHSVKLDNR